MHKTISMTESLAKGLTRRYFTEMERGAETANESFLNNLGSKTPTRKNFNAIVTAALTAFVDYAVGIYEGGSARKPYIAFDLLTPLSDRLYNTWNEKCLSGSSSVINLAPFFCKSGGSAYNIGEHALARLFFRAPPLVADGLIDIKSIKREMVFIPLWASFWGLLISRMSLFGKCYPVLPAPGGMFFAHTSKTTKQVEIRTFVDDSKLSYDQLTVKKMMLDISGDLLSSPLGSFSIIEHFQIDDTGVLMAYMCRKVAKHSASTLLMSNIFQHIHDANDRAQLSQEFSNLISSIASDDLHEYHNSFKTLGVRATQLDIRKKYRHLERHCESHI
jgi:hypothetical protein